MSTILNTLSKGLLEFSSSCLRWPSTRELVFLLYLTLLGLLGNYLNIELFFGVNFLFGSVATMIALRTSGALWGTLIGVVIGSYTYVLWGHPYAIIIFGLEAFIVGFSIWCMKKNNMILTDVIFWLVAGMPLVWIFYSYQLGLSETPMYLIALKQTINGITNVVIANLIIQFSPVLRWSGLMKQSVANGKWSMHSAMNTLLASFVLFPLLTVMVLSGRDKFEEIQMNMEHMIKDEAEDAVLLMDTIFSQHISVVLPLIGANQKKWIDIAANWEELGILGLLNVEISGQDGMVKFSHPRHRRGASEYADAIISAKGKTRYLTNSYVDDGIDGLHFTYIVPLVNGDTLAASFSTSIFSRHLSDIARGTQHIELIDGGVNIVASSDKLDLSEFAQGENPHHLLPPNRNLPSMARWRKAYWVGKVPFMKRSNWIVRVTIPMEQAIDSLQEDYIQKLMAMLIIFSMSVLLAPFVSIMLTTPLMGLVEAADLFATDPDRKDVRWPSSSLTEVNLLIGKFQTFVDAIHIGKEGLVRSEEKFSGIVDNANDAIITIDDNHNIILFNKGAVSTFGYNLNEILGKPLDVLIPENARHGHGKKIDGFAKSTKTTQKMGSRRGIEGIRKNGEVFRAEASIGKLKTQEGNSYTVILQDITERVEAVAQVIQASKLATLGEMATSVAHELNQPLNVIRMAAGNSRRKISKGTADLEYLADKLERIEGQTARAAAIIDHMRMFGRKAEEKPIQVDVRKVVTNTLDLMGEQLKLAGLEIVTEFSDKCSNVLGHTIQMEQVILNLLTNSRDAMTERDGETNVTIRVFEDDEGVHISVHDTGGGIPEDVLPRIFEPFYTTKEMGKGTGLGLSVSYGIIREMGGTIIAENVDEGARFTITFPVST